MKTKIFLLALLVVGCTDSNGARKVLEAQGFTEITTTGYAFFACSEDDTVQTGFRAKGASGQYVDGAVCCGLLFKNCTIRFDQ